jgi:hypothetical protein
MAQGDKFLLDKVLESQRIQIAKNLSDSDFFEFFVAKEVLKNYNLSYEEIDEGIIGGGSDGGIDGIYLFVDDELVGPDFDAKKAKNNAIIELIAIQTKTKSSFSEDAINKFTASMRDLLDTDKHVKDLGTVYNNDLLGFIETYRNIVYEVAIKFPILKFRFLYATKGDRQQVHPNVKRLTNVLEETIQHFFSDAQVSFEFLGARDLLDIAQQQAIQTLTIKTAQYLFEPDGDSVACFVKLKDYFSFITDDRGFRRTHIFDENVREYEGDNQVNMAIGKTLAEGDRSINFWWLNNGITIVASKATARGRSLVVIENPKVVNGLQTSQEIFKHFSKKPSGADDDRLILVRIIVTDLEPVKREILTATNNQTRLVKHFLQIIDDPVHKDIEKYLSYQNFWYERQKNYYKNGGKPKDRIITIQYLAQAVAAILLQEPNNSRGRPANLIQDAEKRNRIFNAKYRFEFYLNCILLMKKVDSLLQKSVPDSIKNEKSNIRFHIATFVAAMKLSMKKPTADKIASELQVDGIEASLLLDYAIDVFNLFEHQKTVSGVDGNKLSRRKEFDDILLNHIDIKLSIS